MPVRKGNVVVSVVSCLMLMVGGQMVAGGWYFCPTEESNDLASCAYCKLSLDGWEPKDDPL